MDKIGPLMHRKESGIYLGASRWCLRFLKAVHRTVSEWPFRLVSWPGSWLSCFFVYLPFLATTSLPFLTASSCVSTKRPDWSCLVGSDHAASHSMAFAVEHATEGPPGTYSAWGDGQELESIDKPFVRVTGVRIKG